jgi:hypothetical protein
MADPGRYSTKPDNTSAPAPSQRTKLPARDAFNSAMKAHYGDKYSTLDDTTPETYQATKAAGDAWSDAYNMHDPDKLSQVRAARANLDTLSQKAIDEASKYKK